MKNYKTLLVDDQERDLSRLERLLLKHPDIFTITGKANSYNEALSLLTTNKYDLTILDNELDDGKDFLDILNNVDHKSLGLVAITSIKADELLDKQITLIHPILFPKPYVDEVILKFIHKLKKLEEISESKGKSRYVIRQLDDSIIIPYEDICFIEGDAVMTNFYCDGQTLAQLNPKSKKDEKFPAITNYEGIGEVEEKLDSKVFFRSNKQCIINVSRIKWHQKDGRGLIVFFRPKNDALDKNMELKAEISRQYKDDFFKHYSLE